MLHLPFFLQAPIMLFRDCTLLTESERLEIEQLFNLGLSVEPKVVPFADGEHPVPSLKIDHLYDFGRAVSLLDAEWLNVHDSVNLNEVKLVWRGIRPTGRWEFMVKHFEHISRLTREANKLSADEVVTIATIPTNDNYLFFKDTSTGTISVCQPFVQFKVPKALFTPEELESFEAKPMTPKASGGTETDYDRFKKLFDGVGQKYTTASLTAGEAEQKGYREDVVYGIALIPSTENPPRHQRAHWRPLDAYTMSLYFDGAGRYLGTCTIPT